VIRVELDPKTLHLAVPNDQGRSDASHGFDQSAGGAAMKKAERLLRPRSDLHPRFQKIIPDCGEFDSESTRHGIGHVDFIDPLGSYGSFPNRHH